MQLTREPALASAAVLTSHWARGDVGTVIMRLAELTAQWETRDALAVRDEARDLILALLILRGKTDAEIAAITCR